VARLERLVPSLEGTKAYKNELAALTRRSNDELFGFVQESSRAFEQGDRSPFDQDIEPIAGTIKDDLLAIRDPFIELNEDVVLAAVFGERVTGPIVAPQIF
jgi:hypothetical protein